MAATDAIKTAIDQATALALTPQQMIAICDLAAAQLLCGKAVSSHTIGTTTFQFTDVTKINEVREYYRQRVVDQTSCVVSLAEF